jgi:hypothetical protein
MAEIFYILQSQAFWYLKVWVAVGGRKPDMNLHTFTGPP